MRGANDHRNSTTSSMRITSAPIIINEVIQRPNYALNQTLQRAKEIHLDSETRPNFMNITDDYHLLENLTRYAKVCERLSVPISKMANSLARAIGIQNRGKFNVLVYDYLLAIPEYPPTVNGRREALKGENRFANMVCYQNKLFGVVVFPSTDHVIFYFPEYPSYNRDVQELIFSYGNKNLRFCPEKHALAFDFIPQMNFVQSTETPIMVTATLKRTLSEARDVPQTVKIIKVDPDTNMYQAPAEQPHSEYIQLE